MDNMLHPTNVLRSLSACYVFWLWTGIACTQGDICKHRCHACHPGEFLWLQNSVTSLSLFCNVHSDSFFSVFQFAVPLGRLFDQSIDKVD